MPSEKIFQENLELLSQIIPQIAVRLQYIDPSEVNFCQTRQGELNLQRTVGKKQHYYHSNYSARKEAEKWLASLDLQHAEVLYIYGVGAGHYYDAVKPWLEEDPGHHLVFLEDDMAVLRRFLETETARKVLDDKQVQLHYFLDFQQGEPMFQWITWYFVGLRPEISALEYYRREREDFVIKLQRKFLHDSVRKESAAAEYTRFGRPFFHNYYANLLFLDRSSHGNKLFGKFKNIPAIITGAGPSLNKNFDVLKNLSDKALILSGGSSLNALSYRGLLPHFGAGIDPNPAQLERLMTNFGYEIPFFYRGRMYDRAFRSIHGHRLFVNGTGGYEVAEWFEEKLGIQEEEIDEGYNVVNFLIEIAYYLGCSPIIVVGMDLAYTDMKSYASGVIGNPEVKEESILNNYDLESGAFLRDDIYEKPVYTLWKWVSESEWISYLAKKRPEIPLINATEGGIGFKGVPNMSLQEAADTYLTQTYDLWSRVHGEIQNAPLDVTSESIQRAMREMYDNLDECALFCEGMLEEIEIMEQKVKAGHQVPHNLQTGKASFYDNELIQQFGYQYVLAGLGYAHAKTLQRRCHEIKYDWTITDEKERNLEILQVNREKVSFTKEAAEVNRELIKEAIDIYRAGGEDTTPFETSATDKEKV